MQPGCHRRRVLEDELASLVEKGMGESAVKKVLSAVRLLEKLGWLRRTVRPGDWYLAVGAAKAAEKAGRTTVKEWASMGALQHMAAAAGSAAEWEIVALAALSCSHCLRASEAITARADGEELVFTGTKSRAGEQRQSMGPWTARWAGFLARLRALHGYHPDRPAWFRGRDGLHDGLRGLLDRPGGSYKNTRWHSFRRYGAAQLYGLGLPVRFIMLWGGWKTPAVAQIYYTAPPRWSFVRGGPLVQPAWDGRTPKAEMAAGTTLGMWPGWVRRELEVPAIRPAGPGSRGAAGSEAGCKRTRTTSPRVTVVEVEESPKEKPQKAQRHSGRSTARPRAQRQLQVERREEPTARAVEPEGGDGDQVGGRGRGGSASGAAETPAGGRGNKPPARRQSRT